MYTIAQHPSLSAVIPALDRDPHPRTASEERFRHMVDTWARVTSLRPGQWLRSRAVREGHDWNRTSIPESVMRGHQGAANDVREGYR